MNPSNINWRSAIAVVVTVIEVGGWPGEQCEKCTGEIAQGDTVFMDAAEVVHLDCLDPVDTVT